MSWFETVMEHKARKAHKCFLCDRKIEPGETYTRRNGKWDGEFYTECYHSVCWTFLEAYWYRGSFNDDIWDSQEVREWLEEEYCRECLGQDADLAECEVPVFRCRKIIEKLMGKEARDG